jgi:hypothetical protein
MISCSRGCFPVTMFLFLTQFIHAVQTDIQTICQSRYFRIYSLSLDEYAASIQKYSFIEEQQVLSIYLVLESLK